MAGMAKQLLTVFFLNMLLSAFDVKMSASL